jgi:Kef-type K+ transport system membrane component KefB
MNTLIAEVAGDIALVVAASSVFGVLARRCGQPAVVGQILAGILFGPTLLGRLPGHLTARLFPQAALGYLNVLAQVAVVIFMFGVGYEIAWPKRGRQGSAPPLIAASALAAPMVLGAGAVLAFRPAFTAVGQSRIDGAFVLFMAVAVSITALPVLAAIVRESELAGTVAGATAISAAGLMDVAAWLALAYALAERHAGTARPFPETLGLLTIFVIVMLLGVRPALRWWFGRRGALLSGQFPVAIVLALGSACITTALGVHPMFGGFIAGLVMPRVNGAPDAEILRRAEGAAAVLLPLFFVVTGLSTNIGALGGSALVVLALVCVIAAVGKLGPAYAASRIRGLAPRDAAIVAALVNTRGLTELIALNAGLQAGIIGDRLFSILVVMALLMTIATAPLLRLVRASAPLREVRMAVDPETPPSRTADR